MLGASGKVRLSAASNIIFIEITQGLDGVTKGYSDSAIIGSGPDVGAINSPLSVRGQLIARLYYTGTSPTATFQFGVGGNVAQDFFTEIEAEDGTIFQYNETGNFTTGGGFTIWRFDNNTIPAVWDGSGLATCRLFLKL